MPLLSRLGINRKSQKITGFLVDLPSSTPAGSVSRIVTSDRNGHCEITTNIEKLDTGLEYELYELKIKMMEYDMKARAYLAMCSARMAQEDIMKILH